MKIGIVLRRLNTRGGTERRTSKLVQGLLQAGHTIHLFAEEWEEDPVANMTCHRIYTIKAARWIKALSFAMLAARATRRCELDLIHSQSRTYADDVATLGGGCHADYLRRATKGLSPLKQTWERNHPFHRAVMALERAQYRNCARIILNSQLAMQGLLRYFPWAKEKCRVVHNGVDSEYFRPDANLRESIRKGLGLDEDTVAFLFVGSGFDRKGLKEFLDALALAQQRRPSQRVAAVVVGRGDIPRYRNHAESIGLGRQVIFAGATGDTMPYYCAADAFCLPTRFDPYANTTNEALAVGLPVITTRSNGACEILGRDEGFIIERTGDIEEMALAMEALFDEARRRAMSSAARRLAQSRPWQLTTEKTLRVYDEIMSERGHRNA